jgi:hypothetical protein
MTENVKSGRSAKAPEADWQGAENGARMARKEQPAAPSRRPQDGPHDSSHYLRLCFGRVAPLAAIHPLVTVGLSAMVLKHIEITVRIVAGAALTVLGVVLVLIG